MKGSSSFCDLPPNLTSAFQAAPLGYNSHLQMTWSIVARDASGAFGVAVASRFFAVGALCPTARSGVGAVCSQALVNPHYGPDGLNLLSKGTSPADAIAGVTSGDEGREHRQLHMVD